MFARLTSFSILPEKLEDAKRIYNEEVIPVVRQQKGNIGVWLLEPTRSENDYISLTEWTSEADANAYHSGGTYQMLVDKLKDMFVGKAVLKTYNVAETKITVPM